MRDTIATYCLTYLMGHGQYDGLLYGYRWHVTVSPDSSMAVGVATQGGTVRGYSGRYHAIRVSFDFSDSAMAPSPRVTNTCEG